MIGNHATLRNVKETIEAALRTSHERKSGIGSLGSVVSHNLAWDATIALNEAGLLDTLPEPETHASEFEAKLENLRDRLEASGFPLNIDPEPDDQGYYDA